MRNSEPLGRVPPFPLDGVAKAPTGIDGLDEVLSGGLPRGRPTLISGGPGCGKTLIGVTFLIRGATDYGEPGVFISFEETAEDLAKNVASLGYDVAELTARKHLAIDHVRVERSEIEETGEYDLEGLFIRLGFAIDAIGAKRIVLDTIETLFAGLSNEAILRAELRRLLGWLKQRGLTAIITGEQGERSYTRYGLEEYVSDCVIMLDHRVHDQVSTRRLRVVKYRGSAHGTNEYPFLIDHSGIAVMPITSAGLAQPATAERIATGIPDLDAMLGGKGFFRGSSILVSGTAGSGKSSVAATFVDAACARGERCLFFAFEESPQQVVRNMRSIGIDLGRWAETELLRFFATRPTFYGLEMHLAAMHREVERTQPQVVVCDPVSSLLNSAATQDVHGLVLRLVDYLKSRQITTLFTNLTHGNLELARTDANISSLMDSWLLLLNAEAGGEYNRQLYLLKSRGMPHSNQVREFLMTDDGITLQPVYTGPDGVLTGSARLAQEASERAAAVQRRQEIAYRERQLAHRRQKLEAEIAALRAEVEAEAEELRQLVEDERTRNEQIKADREAIATSRRVLGSNGGSEDKDP